MHILQVLFAVLLLLQAIDASLIQLSRDRRSPKVLNIRLAGNGSTSSSGRVEVAISNGTWGTIRQDGFDSPDAIVICRMLGFNTSRAISYYYNFFGAGSGPVWLSNLGCHGSETHLDQCSSGDIYDSNHYYDIGVACDFVIQNVRLVGGRGTHEGRVEILGPDGMWGTLANYLDGNAATVICRMLGFETTDVVSVFHYAHFGKGSGLTFYLASSGCTGRETSLAECGTYDIRANVYGTHDYDMGLRCNKENDIRLVGGNSELEGRVEVYHNGVWGTVCNNGFDNRDAEVICYMLGYDTRSSQSYPYNRFGSGTGQIWLNNLSCNGTESRLDECPSITWGTNSCSHSQDVGVDCHQNLRLYRGRYPSEGYLQIGNDWKTICGYNSDGNLARVACQSLGFNTSYWVPTYYLFMGSVATSNTTIECPRGTESNVAECKQGTSIHCDSNYYAFYANCTGSLNARLVGGSHNGEGKLMIQNNLDYRSYRVCTDVWTDTEATLFCQLIRSDVKGKVYGRVIRNTAFDQQPGSFVFLSTHCNGGSPFCIFEVNSTESCPYTDIAMSCTHSEQAPQHNVRLVGGQADNEGSVEIKYNHKWYTLCDFSWDTPDAMVVCRSLGYWSTSPTAYSNAWFGQGSVPSYVIYPNCNNYETSILDCFASNMFGERRCSHLDDAGVRCTSVALGRNKVRLAYGSTPSNGKLEVFYNGHWGGVCMKSWTQRNTDVVCRMMMYHSMRPSYYVFNGTSTTINIGELQCRGNETDIGLCKAFLDKRNCTDEVVGINCSVEIHARLTGGNSTMGYAQLQINGNWTQLCASGWNNEEATVFCRTLGFSLAVATTNVSLSNGVSAREYRSIDCSGWEDHIDQCLIQSPPGNCGYATVNCLKCFYEYTSTTGTVVSPNYTSSYPLNWSCLYIIRPYGYSRSGLYTLTFKQISLDNEGDEVQVHGGFPGTTLYSWKGYMNTSFDLSPIIAKEFSIHFHSDNYNEYSGFQAQWAPSAIEDALTTGCMPSGWDIQINITILRMLYPDVNPADIYMNVRPCTGKVVDDGLQFLHAYSSCNTQRQITSSEVIYTNNIIQPIIDSRYPSIVFEHKWRVETRCSMPITGVNTTYMQPTDGQADSVNDNGHQNLTGTTNGALLFHFYTDPAFRNEIKGNLKVPFGNELYVKVVYDSRESNMKMRVDTCTVFDQSSSSQKLLVIQDGCPTNPMVHLISTENHETRFSYQVFEFQDSSHSLGLNCNATFCIYDDNSHTCTPGCTTRRAIIPKQESRLTLTREVHSGRMSLLMEAPDAVLSANLMDRHLQYGEESPK